jgi:glycosyltransferase involved in cell wall biosynthesis
VDEAIRSVLEQTYPNIELIVIDGGSTDGSVEIIRRYADRLAYWSSEKDSGQADAINKGFRHARGEVLAWLNSDERRGSSSSPGREAALGSSRGRSPIALSGLQRMVQSGCTVVISGARRASWAPASLFAYPIAASIASAPMAQRTRLIATP